MTKCPHGKRLDERCLVCEKLSEVESKRTKETAELLVRITELEEAAEPFAELNKSTLKEFDDDMIIEKLVTVGDIRKLAALLETIK